MLKIEIDVPKDSFSDDDIINVMPRFTIKINNKFFAGQSEFITQYKNKIEDAWLFHSKKEVWEAWAPSGEDYPGDNWIGFIEIEPKTI